MRNRIQVVVGKNVNRRKHNAEATLRLVFQIPITLNIVRNGFEMLKNGRVVFCSHAAFVFAVLVTWCAAGGACVAQVENLTSAHDQWGQWRGPDGTGVSTTATPPTRWSETENVRWKTELPGLGHSTPVIWDQTIVVTTAIPFGEKFAPIADGSPGSHDNLTVSQKFKFVAIAINRADGKIKWQRELHEAVPHEGAHVSASLASASPIIDGEHIIVYFGTFGIYCLDLEGNVVWEKSLGTMNSKHGHGEGASPALFEDTLIVNWDHEGDSFIVALNKNTGEEIWRTDRTEVTSWSSPIVYSLDGEPQVIVAGTGAVRAYELETGKVIWECAGLSNNIVATPIAYDGIAFVGSSYEIQSMFALKLKGAVGNLHEKEENIAWIRASRTPYVPTPLLYRGSLYYLRHYQGILSICDAKSGEETKGPFRLNGIRDVYASPVAADGKVYITDLDGVTLVLSEPDMPRLLSANRLDDSFSASVAMVGDELYLRGKKFLYCIAEEKK